MPAKVGSKGQIVIEKGIRDSLGVKPGWRALQRLVDDHLEIYFVPPEHNRSLKGSLARHIKVKVAPGEEWDQARENAWAEAAERKTSQERPAPMSAFPRHERRGQVPHRRATGDGRPGSTDH